MFMEVKTSNKSELKIKGSIAKHVNDFILNHLRVLYNHVTND